MARRRPTPPRHRRLPSLPGLEQVEPGPDGYLYEVRRIVGSRAIKTYRCPGCDHEIRSGTPHVVVWLTDSGPAGADDRRHWHTPCWANRATRGPTRRWS